MINNNKTTTGRTKKKGGGRERENSFAKKKEKCVWVVCGLRVVRVLMMVVVTSFLGCRWLVSWLVSWLVGSKYMYKI